jgi:hypothetical protein
MFKGLRIEDFVFGIIADEEDAAGCDSERAKKSLIPV